MKNIHILPTDKPSFGKYLVINKEGKLCIWNTNTMGTQKTLVTQHIYITSDEEIKDRYWVYCTIDKDIDIANDRTNYHRDEFQKIILTTDPDLIKDGVQAIDDEFIEWFIKNPSCEKIEVKSESSRKHGMWKPEYYPQVYKIIIPKEEPKFGDSFENLSNVISTANFMFGGKEESNPFELPKTLPDNIFYESLDSKQETIEEAAKEFVLSHDFSKITTQNHLANRCFQFGASWSQEQILQFLYSEIIERRDYSASRMCEEVIKFIEQLKTKK